MFSSTTPACIVDLMCIADHMCLLACNVCGGTTAVAFSCCGILHLTHCGSTSGPAWYPSCPVISGKLPSSGLLHYLWLISEFVDHLRAVLTPSRHWFYITESIFYFFAACPICPAKVSHYYRPTLVDTASVHIVKGITKNIHKKPPPGARRHVVGTTFRANVWLTDCVGPILSQILRPKLNTRCNQVNVRRSRDFCIFTAQESKCSRRFWEMDAAMFTPAKCAPAKPFTIDFQALQGMFVPSFTQIFEELTS